MRKEKEKGGKKTYPTRHRTKAKNTPHLSTAESEGKMLKMAAVCLLRTGAVSAFQCKSHHDDDMRRAASA